MGNIANPANIDAKAKIFSLLGRADGDYNLNVGRTMSFDRV